MEVRCGRTRGEWHGNRHRRAGVPGRIFGMGKARHQRHGHVRVMPRIKSREDPTERVN